MNVCLVYPPTQHMIRTNVPSVVDDVTGCYPPLGVLYVAGAVRASGRHDVTVIDAVAEHLTDAEMEARIRAANPDVVGIEVLTFTLIDAYAAARAVKRIDPDLPVVAGGPHVNLYPHDTVALDEIDYVLLGESESNIVPFLDALASGRGMAEVPGVVYRDTDDTLVTGPPNPLIEDLDALPMPARDLLDPSRYGSVLGQGRFLTTIMSSRGCPARCIFCDRPHLGKAFRARSADSVVTEMQTCAERFGIDEFFFYDDTFTMDRQRVLDICGAIQSAGLKSYWDIRARVSTVNPEVLQALHAAGCRRIHFGIESGNPDVLKTMRKGVDLAYARQVVKWCRSLGIETLGYFMFGFPGEGPAEVEDTIRYALSLDSDYIHVAVTTPFPGTELYRMGLEQGLYEEDYWAAFARNPQQDFVPRLWDETLSRDELIDAMLRCYRRFYRRPRYLIRRLLALRSWREFTTKARAGLKLLTRTHNEHAA